MEKENKCTHMKVTYRKGSITDLQSLKKLGLMAYSEYSSVLTPDNWKKFNTSLNDEAELEDLINKSAVFVCENDDIEIIGMVYFIPSGNSTKLFSGEWCCIRRLAVKPQYRKHGIAKQLTQHCISYANETKENTLALHTAEFMNDARAMYERMGFEKKGTEFELFGKNYWIYTLDLGNARL